MSAGLVLGTAQLGNAYGVNNAVGELGEQAAFDVLDAAAECGVRLLDTAEAYGKSQEVIGRYIAAHPGCGFEVCTKLSSPVADPAAELAERVGGQLDVLGVGRIAIYYLHDFAMFRDALLLEGLASLRERGLVERVGVSVYEPRELESVLAGGAGLVDAVQIPLNVFNCHRWLAGDLLERAAASGVELLARSAYLQGLVFMDPGDARVAKIGMSEHVAAFRRIADETGADVAELALGFVRGVEPVRYVLLGAETPGQVRANAAMFGRAPVWTPEMVERQIASASSIPDEAADPRFW